MKKYDIIVGTSRSELVEKVNQAGEEWEPLGGPLIYQSDTNKTLIGQAMVRKKIVIVRHENRININDKKGVDCIADPVRHAISFNKAVEELPKVVRG